MYESVRAQMRITVKRLLRKYKYPPDKQADAVKLIIEQAEKCLKMNYSKMTKTKTSHFKYICLDMAYFASA